MLKKYLFLILFSILCTLNANTTSANLSSSPQSIQFTQKIKNNQEKSLNKEQAVKNKSKQQEQKLKEKRKQIDEKAFIRMQKYQTSKKLTKYPPQN